MAKHTGLILSSVVATALSLSATSLAQTPPETSPLALWDANHHVSWMFDLAAALDGVDIYNAAAGLPESNHWAAANESCSIIWTDDPVDLPYASTKGSCFLTLGIRKAHPNITSSMMFSWWLSSSPAAPKYYDVINAQNRFWKIDQVSEVGTGDVLAVKYTSSSGAITGYTMVVVTSQYWDVWDNDTPMDASDDLPRYLVQVVDSTTTAHWDEDSRYQADPTTSNGHDQGVGTGYFFLTVAANGELAGHAWSNQDQNKSDYYENNAAGRPMVIGRFDSNKAP